jgi:hypothetical protein
MKTTNYNIWYALLYELLRSLGEHYNKVRSNKIVKMILQLLSQGLGPLESREYAQIS